MTRQTPIGKLDRYIHLTNVREELRKDLAHIQAELNDLNYELADLFLDSGTTKIAQQGYTIYLYQQTHAAARGGDTAALTEAVAAAGLDDLISVQPQRFAAWVREQPRNSDGDPILPPGIANAAAVHKSVEVRCRRSD